jgi:Ca2+-binding RTX toxin-like protein
MNTLENLESRRLFAANIDPAGNVVADGTETADQFDLRVSGSDLMVTITTNGSSAVARFPLASVRTVAVNGRGDRDKVTVQSNVTIGCRIDGGTGNDTLQGGAGPDTLIGGPDSDQLEGNAGNDTLDGGAGSDKIFGNEDVDLVDYSSRTANLTIMLDRQANDGEPGENDNIQDSCEQIFCGSGNDTITTDTSPTGNSSDNVFWGMGGNDTLDGGVGNDWLEGGAGDDSLSGNVGLDTLSGDIGNDTLDGGNDNDLIWGWFGNDSIRGGAGSDQLYGQQDDDRIDGGLGADLIVGDVGNDTVDYSMRRDDISVTLDGLANDGTKRREPTLLDPLGYVGEWDNVMPDVENVLCGSGNDYVSSPDSSNVANHFVGGWGDDNLYGGGGDDVLEGGAGNDWLGGGAGFDRMFGNDGNDTFFARDNGAMDLIDGGAGSDRAQIDPTDMLTSIESTFDQLSGFFL